MFYWQNSGIADRALLGATAHNLQAELLLALNLRVHAMKTTHQLVDGLVENILRTPDLVAHLVNLAGRLGGHMNHRLTTALDDVTPHTGCFVGNGYRVR